MRILICAPSNAAIDSLMKKIIAAFKAMCLDSQSPQGTSNASHQHVLPSSCEMIIYCSCVNMSLEIEEAMIVFAQNFSIICDTHTSKRLTKIVCTGTCGDINLVRLGSERAISKDLIGFSLDRQVRKALGE